MQIRAQRKTRFNEAIKLLLAVKCKKSSLFSFIFLTAIHPSFLIQSKMQTHIHQQQNRGAQYLTSQPQWNGKLIRPGGVCRHELEGHTETFTWWGHNRKETLLWHLGEDYFNFSKWMLFWRWCALRLCGHECCLLWHLLYLCGFIISITINGEETYFLTFLSVLN